MMKLPSCSGASRVIADRPTGERHSSPGGVQQVDQEDEEDRRRRADADSPRAPDEDEEAKADLRQAQRELGRRRGLEPALGRAIHSPAKTGPSRTM